MAKSLIEGFSTVSAGITRAIRKLYVGVSTRNKIAPIRVISITDHKDGSFQIYLWTTRYFRMVGVLFYGIKA